MVVYCRRRVDDGLLDPKSEAARFYLGDLSADPPRAPPARPEPTHVIPMPLPPRAPPARPEPERKKRDSRSGVAWIGCPLIEVDHKLIAELTPDGLAVKVGVARGSPAAKARLKTGDYVLAAGQTTLVPLRDFDALRLPAGEGILVRYHRPGRDGPGCYETIALELRRRPGRRNRRHGRLILASTSALASRVTSARRFGEMAGHPLMTDGCHRFLVRLMHSHDGPLGMCPSYKTVAAKLGRSRRTMMRSTDRLEGLGILEKLIGKGPMTVNGPTNA